MKPWSRQLVVGFEGVTLSAKVRSWLAVHRPAGVLLFSRNVQDYTQLVDLCRDLHGAVTGLEISVDHEGGPVSHLAAALGRPPAAWTLGVLDEVALTRRVYRETAQRLAAAGIDRVLGPVADVMFEGANPVIGSRAFGADADLVSRHVTAAVQGLVEGGVKACLKHWPGHGLSRSDTHEQVSLQPRAAGQVEAQPFVAGLAAGADAVMVGHLPTPGSDLPATLDSRFLASTRERLRVAGKAPLLFADDVTMGALRESMASKGFHGTPDEGRLLLDPSLLSKRWLERVVVAGCERILLRGIPWTALPLTGRVKDHSPGPIDAGVNLPPAEGYRIVHQKIWQQVPRDFFQPDKDLLWVDLSEDDRWAGIGTGQGQLTREVRARLEAGFRSVHPWSAAIGGESWDRLLVTSFRPWSLAAGDVPKLNKLLNNNGVALTAGHPQLASTVKDFLPEAWRIGTLFDIRPQMWQGGTPGNII